jgi:hypothetical protein
MTYAGTCAPKQLLRKRLFGDRGGDPAFEVNAGTIDKLAFKNSYSPWWSQTPGHSKTRRGQHPRPVTSGAASMLVQYNTGTITDCSVKNSTLTMTGPATARARCSQTAAP